MAPCPNYFHSGETDVAPISKLIPIAVESESESGAATGVTTKDEPCGIAPAGTVTDISTCVVLTGAGGAGGTSFSISFLSELAAAAPADFLPRLFEGGALG